jgi:hypothetical protein
MVMKQMTTSSLDDRIAVDPPDGVPLHTELETLRPEGDPWLSRTLLPITFSLVKYIKTYIIRPWR